MKVFRTTIDWGKSPRMDFRGHSGMERPRTRLNSADSKYSIKKQLTADRAIDSDEIRFHEDLSGSKSLDTTESDRKAFIKLTPKT